MSDTRHEDPAPGSYDAARSGAQIDNGNGTVTTSVNQEPRPTIHAETLTSDTEQALGIQADMNKIAGGDETE